MATTADWRYVTDGGLETDLIFHHGVDLPEFAAYPLVWTDEGRALLRAYYDGYADVAGAVGEPGSGRAPAGDGPRMA